MVKPDCQPEKDDEHDKAKRADDHDVAKRLFGAVGHAGSFTQERAAATDRNSLAGELGAELLHEIRRMADVPEAAALAAVGFHAMAVAPLPRVLGGTPGVAVRGEGLFAANHLGPWEDCTCIDM